MSNTVADIAYGLVEVTARETPDSTGLEALLALLDRFDNPAGLSGANASIKKSVVETVQQLHKKALARDAQEKENCHP